MTQETTPPTDRELAEQALVHSAIMQIELSRRDRPDLSVARAQAMTLLHLYGHHFKDLRDLAATRPGQELAVLTERVDMARGERPWPDGTTRIDDFERMRTDAYLLGTYEPQVISGRIAVSRDALIHALRQSHYPEGFDDLVPFTLAELVQRVDMTRGERPWADGTTRVDDEERVRVEAFIAARYGARMPEGLPEVTA